MDAQHILEVLVRIWCREHGQELISLTITKEKDDDNSKTA